MLTIQQEPFVMGDNNFMVSEHASYDMVQTWISVANSVYGGKKDSLLRMHDAMRGVVTPIRCRFFLFPDY